MATRPNTLEQYYSLVLIGVGVVLALSSFAWLVMLARGCERAFPRYGWWGLGACLGLEAMLALSVPVVATYFTALIWSAYIVAVDAAVFRRRGDSLLHHGGQFVAMAALSVVSWIIFEAYNLRLANWTYVGIPKEFWQLALGSTWAFATITPGILETAELVHAAWASKLRCRPWRPGGGGTIIAVGVACLVIPLIAPLGWAPYLFALVWAGFLFTLDPVHRMLGWPSLLAGLEHGEPGAAVALLAAGGACGFFWEFWNYWASARWQYVFPILHRYRIFAMPIPGFAGFPPFAIECYCLYILLSRLLLPKRLRSCILSTCPDAPI
ncbi:MAG TPA: hypothetical protein VIC32_04105 [Terriglobales bacterium]